MSGITALAPLTVRPRKWKIILNIYHTQRRHPDMKKSMKFGIVALTMSALTLAFAENADVEVENEYEAIGWTPIAVSLCSPVQIPWGSHTWDVFGLNLGILWSD